MCWDVGCVKQMQGFRIVTDLKYLKYYLFHLWSHTAHFSLLSAEKLAS